MERDPKTINALISPNIQRSIREGFKHSLPPGRLHFAAHSHHPWPDVTQNAQLEYWKCSAELLDSKWQTIFQSKIPETKHMLTTLLSIGSPDQIVEGTSTFELITRIFSSFDPSMPIRILTTDSEFYSFERFARRLAELPTVQIDRIPTVPFESFEDRLIEAFNSKKYDIVFSSLVFFNSGFYADQLLNRLIEIADRATVIVDAYHAIGAVPLDLKFASLKLFIVGGGYKYLGAGEGVCFLIAPPNTELRPLLTGWLAEYGSLTTGLGEKVGYAQSANRFAGATYDPTGWFRLNAVLQWWTTLEIDPGKIHSHVRDLQHHFLRKLSSVEVHGFKNRSDWGNFLAFPLPEAHKAAEYLKTKNIYVDARDGFLRVGFGYYQTTSEVEGVADAIRCQLS